MLCSPNRFANQQTVWSYCRFRPMPQFGNYIRQPLNKSYDETRRKGNAGRKVLFPGRVGAIIKKIGDFFKGDYLQMTCNYSDEDKRQMLITAKSRNKSRLRELIDFCRLSGFRKLGIATCAGVLVYGARLARLLEEAGFEVFIINCKESGLKASELNEELHGPSCDPLSQAEYLNGKGTELNIIVGLCLGHGLLFEKHSAAPMTTFLVKDFATGHKTAESLV